MPVYKTTAAAGGSRAEELVIVVVIFRDDIQVATFTEHYRSSVADPAILNLLEKRVRDFIRIDDERIAKEEVDDRAEALASSMDDRIWP